MTPAELYEYCEKLNCKEVIVLVDRKWQNQTKMRLLPGGKTIGIPRQKVGKKTLVKFNRKELLKELEPFKKLADIVKESPEILMEST